MFTLKRVAGVWWLNSKPYTSCEAALAVAFAARRDS